ncbi:transposase [Nitrobacter vulgaris]|nr:transposase [Nitrobacter vulgaris]
MARYEFKGSSLAKALGAWLGLVPKQSSTGGKARLSEFQAWQRLFAHSTHPRRSRGFAIAVTKRYATGVVAKGNDRAGRTP